MDTGGKTHSEQRGGLIVLTVSIAIIAIIVIVGVVIGFTLEGLVVKIILLSLIGLVVLVGILSFFILECQRRRTTRGRNQGGPEWERSTFEEQRRLKNQPSAPRESGQTTVAGTWRYSNRATMPA